MMKRLKATSARILAAVLLSGLVWPAGIVYAGPQDGYFSDLQQAEKVLRRNGCDAAIPLLTQVLSHRTAFDWIAFIDRGNCLFRDKWYQGAAADYTASLERVPNERKTLLLRGNAYHLNGQYDLAIADYTQALKVQEDAGVYENRGISEYALGQYKLAIWDFSTARKLSPSGYDAMFLYLAQRRAGVATADDDLSAFAKTLNEGAWPWPIVDFYLGRSSYDDVLMLAQRGDVATQQVQRCEAAYYVGTLAAQNTSAGWTGALWTKFFGHPQAMPDAKALLTKAANTCDVDAIEFRGAAAELVRLGGK